MNPRPESREARGTSEVQTRASLVSKEEARGTNEVQTRASLVSKEEARGTNEVQTRGVQIRSHTTCCWHNATSPNNHQPTGKGRDFVMQGITTERHTAESANQSQRKTMTPRASDSTTVTTSSHRTPQRDSNANNNLEQIIREFCQAQRPWMTRRVP